MLTILLTAVYFYVFFHLVDLIFRHAVGPVPNILSIICLVIALIASVIMANFTVKKIREKYQK